MLVTWCLGGHVRALADDSATAPGAALFGQYCAGCHDGGNERAPNTSILKMMSPGVIYRVIATGSMSAVARHLSKDQRYQIVEFLTHAQPEDSASVRPALKCKNNPAWFDYAKHPAASGWGLTGPENTRFIPGEAAGLTPEQVKRLKPKWVFAFPNTLTPHSQPAIAGGAVFVGDEYGVVYALDAKTGCLRWRFDADASVRTAVTVRQWVGDNSRSSGQAPAIYFGDQRAQTYAVNAVTGALLWKTKVDDDPLAVHTGTATLLQRPDGNYLYVPVSAPLLDMLAGNTKFPCCQFRGSVSALNADTGKVLWKSYVIPTVPTERGKNSKGVMQYGPSGAGVWDSPTIDVKRGLLYVGTGENSSDPYENGGAVVAMHLRDGAIAWVTSIYSQEGYNDSCRQTDRTNCPKIFKGRFGLDVSASPMLLSDRNGKSIIVAANKPGDVIGIDPDNGNVLWRRRIVRGDFNQGVLFGMASEGSRVFAPTLNAQGDPRKGSYWGIDELGIYAMDGFTGEPLWMSPLTTHCRSQQRCLGYAAPLTAIPGVIFAGALDGIFRAFDSNSGEMLWEFDTAQKFTALNGEVAQGGSMNGTGPVVVDGMVYVNSGYLDGNAFIAFSVDGR